MHRTYSVGAIILRVRNWAGEACVMRVTWGSRDYALRQRRSHLVSNATTFAFSTHQLHESQFSLQNATEIISYDAHSAENAVKAIDVKPLQPNGEILANILLQPNSRYSYLAASALQCSRYES